MTSILIVKTSSLGDIIQAFHVLDDLHSRFPQVAVDWVVESSFSSIVAAHPLIRRVIPIPFKEKKPLWTAFKELRREKYDLVFDLQGNCKSGLVTLFSRGKTKVGYSLKSVREWPNILATHIRFHVSKQQNIRRYYLGLLEQYFKKAVLADIQGVKFKINSEEKEKVASILAPVSSKLKIMVCPGSKWANKQLKLETWISLLQRVEQKTGATFLLIWGDAAEKKLCLEMQPHLKSFVVDKLSIPVWQNLMSEMDLVIAVDSSALHLCGTTKTASFGIFGPTSPQVFKPIGRHFAIQGTCPYQRQFEKQCPLLRTCPTGACIKDLKESELFEALRNQCGFLPL